MERSPDNTQPVDVALEHQSSAVSVENVTVSGKCKRALGTIGVRFLHSFDTATQSFAQDIVDFYPDGSSRVDAADNTHTNTLNLR